MAQAVLPAPVLGATKEELFSRIVEAKRALGRRLVVLGHHYQRDEVIQHADFRGDSFKLAQLAASRAEAEFIVFCGVHFMAESADVLRQPHQTVILPDLKAEWDYGVEDLERLTARCFRPGTPLVLGRGFCSVPTNSPRQQIDEVRA